jgi:hypothetical protein
MDAFAASISTGLNRQLSPLQVIRRPSAFGIFRSLWHWSPASGRAFADNCPFLHQHVLVYELLFEMPRPSFSMICGHLDIRFSLLSWGVLFAICSRFCSQDEAEFIAGQIQNEFARIASPGSA